MVTNEEAGQPAPCTEQSLSDAEARLGVDLPDGLRRVYQVADGRFRADGRWWVVWPIDRLVTENLSGWDDRGLPRTWLAFGDDGTGDPFCLSPSPSADEVVRWSWIAGEVDHRAGSLADFMDEWVPSG